MRVLCPEWQQGGVLFKGAEVHGAHCQLPITSFLLLHTPGSCLALSGKLLRHGVAGEDRKPPRRPGREAPPGVGLLHPGHRFWDYGPEKHPASYTRSGIVSGLW